MIIAPPTLEDVCRTDLYPQNQWKVCRKSFSSETSDTVLNSQASGQNSPPLSNVRVDGRYRKLVRDSDVAESSMLLVYTRVSSSPHMYPVDQLDKTSGGMHGMGGACKIPGHFKLWEPVEIGGSTSVIEQVS